MAKDDYYVIVYQIQIYLPLTDKQKLQINNFIDVFISQQQKSNGS